MKGLLKIVAVIFIITGVVFFVGLDDDGLNLYEELDEGTNPINDDTDNDGLNDGEEVYDYNTNPEIVDTDNDGLNDGEEVYKYNTNPTIIDTDNDGLNDGEEIKSYDTDPTRKDTDNDGLTDGSEIDDYNTNPVKKDTDNDGLNDGEEIQIGTDPFNSDTDNDGLNDGEEIKSYDTDPTRKDTDNDGFTDSYEVRNIGFNANKVDIKIEVDYSNGLKPSDSDGYDKVVEQFDDAPINTDNTIEQGVNLHINYDEQALVSDTVSSTQYQSNYKDIYKDDSDAYHVLIAEEVTAQGVSNVGGVTNTGSDGILVEDKESTDLEGSIFMHELGHQLGLYPSDYQGIDSKHVSYSRYPSAMNYNCPLFNCDVIRYSTDGSFNDWNHINESLPEVLPNK